MSDAMNFVKETIAANAVAVFSKSYCPYCTKAKQALSAYPLKNYTVIELDSRNDGAAIQSALSELTGGSSVPRVFIGGKFIGGGDDTQALHKSGGLEPLLKAASAL